jgi:hypothetical protein
MPGPRTNAAFYAAPVEEFLAASEEEVYAPLAAPKGYTLAPEQLSAWPSRTCKKEPATIFKRPEPTSQGAVKMVAGTFLPLTPATWGTGSYSPTPTIIEAARSLYARHTVHDITRSDAGAVNLAATSGCIERIIAAAKAGRRKAIVFVTGVPGAGKTLVGLNVATRHGERSDAAHAVFLFGKARWWRCCGRPWPATTRSATPLRPTTMSWCSTRPSGRGMPGSSHPS